MEFHPAISEPISYPQIALSKHRLASFTSSLLVLFTNIYESFLLNSYIYWHFLLWSYPFIFFTLFLSLTKLKRIGFVSLARGHFNPPSPMCVHCAWMKAPIGFINFGGTTNTMKFGFFCYILFLSNRDRSNGPKEKINGLVTDLFYLCDTNPFRVDDWCHGP